MPIVVGLGNPGASYLHTRHNAGWMFVDQLATALAAKNGGQLVVWKQQLKWQLEVCQIGDWQLLKPLTFMNNSGLAVRQFIEYYWHGYQPQAQMQDLAMSLRTNPAEEKTNPLLIVAHDDLDLEVGAIKSQFGRGPKVHNGLLSLTQHLGTERFWHVRLGVDSRGGQRDLPGKDYVLQNFSPDERAKFNQSVGEIINLWLLG